MTRPCAGFLFTLVVATACFAQKYTTEGELILPGDYRSWIFLTSGIGMTYSDRASEHPAFGNVFVNPAAYESFRKTGKWPDKTTLIIEVRASEKDASSRDGKFQKDLLAYEVHVKDTSRTGTDPGGWLFYSFGGDQQRAKPIAKQEACTGCHSRNAATDTTFVQFYPTLIDIAKAHGNYREPETK